MRFKERDVCGRINEILIEEGLSDHQAAKKIMEATGAEISMQNISSMRMRPAFGVDKLVLFTATFNKYNPDWILRGTGAKYRQEESVTVKELRTQNKTLDKQLQKMQQMMGNKDIPELKTEIISLKERLADCRLELAESKMENSRLAAEGLQLENMKEEIKYLKAQLELSRQR